MEYGAAYAALGTIGSLARLKVLPFSRKEREWILSRVKPGAVLDYGCNTGRFTDYIRGRMPQCRCYGADINEHALSLASRRYPRVRFMSTTDRFLRTQRFDTVLAAHTLEHLDNPAAALRDLAAMLAPGGRLIIAVPQERLRGESTAHWLLINAARLTFENPHKHILEFEDCAEMLRAAGLALRDYSYINYLPPYASSSKRRSRYSLVMVGERSGTKVL